jgi:hypothetical protein
MLVSPESFNTSFLPISLLHYSSSSRAKDKRKRFKVLIYVILFEVLSWIILTVIVLTLGNVQMFTLFFGSTRVLTQGLVFARQELST